MLHTEHDSVSRDRLIFSIERVIRGTPRRRREDFARLPPLPVSEAPTTRQPEERNRKVRVIPKRDRRQNIA